MRVHARLLRSVIDIARGVCSLQISIEPVSFRGIGRDEGTAARVRYRHGVEIVEPLKVVSRGEDWMQAWNQIWDVD